MNIVYSPEKVKTISLWPKHSTNIIFEHPGKINIMMVEWKYEVLRLC